MKTHSEAVMLAASSSCFLLFLIPVVLLHSTVCVYIFSTTVKYVYVPSDDTGERGTGFVLIKSF